MTFEPKQATDPYDGKPGFMGMSRKLPLLAPHYAPLVRHGLVSTCTLLRIPLRAYGIQKIKDWIWAICDEATSRYPNLESLTIEVPMIRSCKESARLSMWNEWSTLWDTDKDNSLERRVKLFDQILNDFGNGEKLFPSFVKLVVRGAQYSTWVRVYSTPNSDVRSRRTRLQVSLE